MGNCYFKCLEVFDSKGKTLIYEKIRAPSFMDHYGNAEFILRKRSSHVLKEENFQNENWFYDLPQTVNGKPFLDLQKFVNNYSHFKFDQVKLF